MLLNSCPACEGAERRRFVEVIAGRATDMVECTTCGDAQPLDPPRPRYPAPDEEPN